MQNGLPCEQAFAAFPLSGINMLTGHALYIRKWVFGCVNNTRFSNEVPAASPCSQNRHLYAAKGTSQHWKPMALDAMPRRKEGGKKEEEKLRSPELQLIIVGHLSFSPSVFTASPILSIVSQPLGLLQASSSLSQWVPTRQYICPGCWH